MKFYLLFALLLCSSVLAAQEEFISILKKINAPLFMKNMNSKLIYTKSVCSRHALFTFERDFKERNTDNIKEIFLYRYLPGKKKEELAFILELKLDKRKINTSLNDSIVRQPIHYSDFGLKIYTFNPLDQKWQDVSLDVLPPDFIYKIETEIPSLQKNDALYFYNLNMQKLVKIHYAHSQIVFAQNEKVVLKLLWKKNKFVWK